MGILDFTRLITRNPCVLRGIIISLLTFTIISYFSCYAKILQTVSAEYIYYAPPTMNIVEAKRIALERAKIKAVEAEFGSIVSQSNSTVVANINGKSETRFFSLGSSDVKGEWIETIGVPQYGEISYMDNMLIIPCFVKGKARELQSNTTDFIAIPLRNGVDKKYESYDFKVGDELYLYFKSPIKGYLSVYLVDEASEMVYCALPYRNSDGQSKAISADNEYYLFSKNHCEIGERNIVDEYIMTANGELEYNDIYVLFSPDTQSSILLNNENAPSSPKYTTWNDFQKWLAKTRLNDINLSVSKIIISITK